MTSFSKPGGKALPNVPAPPGSRSAASYSRIIPREELGEFASWQPGAFGAPGGPAERRKAARAAESEVVTQAEWRDRMAEARKAGYQDGYRDGLVGLENFKQAQAKQAAAQIHQLLQSFEAQWTQLEPLIAQSIARSAVALARRVLRQELATRPEHVLGLAQEAVSAIMLSARRIEVHVHAEDLPLVAEGLGELLKSRGARLLADAQVQRGGCRVTSDIGSVEATIAARWREAAAALGSESAYETEAEVDTEDTAPHDTPQTHEEAAP